MNLAPLLPYLVAFGLVLCRCLGTFMLVPVLGGEAIPLRIRGAVGVVMAAVITPIVGQVEWPGPVAVLLAAAGEFLLGLAMGLVLKLVLVSAEFAGEVAGMQMGLSFNRVVDPLTSQSMAVTARLMGVFATLLLIAIDGHHVMLRGLAASLVEAPVGTVLPRASYAATLFPLLSTVTSSGLRIAAPVVAALLMTNATVGLIARAAPKLQLFVLAFGISTAIGMILFSTSIRPSMSLLIDQIRQLPRLLEAVIGG